MCTWTRKGGLGGAEEKAAFGADPERPALDGEHPADVGLLVRAFDKCAERDADTGWADHSTTHRPHANRPTAHPTAHAHGRRRRLLGRRAPVVRNRQGRLHQHPNPRPDHPLLPAPTALDPPRSTLTTTNHDRRQNDYPPTNPAHQLPCHPHRPATGLTPLHRRAPEHGAAPPPPPSRSPTARASRNRNRRGRMVHTRCTPLRAKQCDLQADSHSVCAFA